MIQLIMIILQRPPRKANSSVSEIMFTGEEEEGVAKCFYREK
jgi:hypothetical protein